MSRTRLLASIGFATVMAALITGGSAVGWSASDLFISTSGVQERSAKYGVLHGKLKYVEVFVESTDADSEAALTFVFQHFGPQPCGANSYFTEYEGLKLKPKRALFEFGMFYPVAMSVPVPKKGKVPPKNPLDVPDMDEQKWTFKLQAGNAIDANLQNNTSIKVFKFAAGGTPKCRNLCPDTAAQCIPPVPQQ